MAERVWAAYCSARRCFDAQPSFPSAFLDGDDEGNGNGDGAGRERVPPVPSAFQIRLGGCKGMVSLDVRLGGSVIATRKSMDKFDAMVRDPVHSSPLRLSHRRLHSSL